jgi:hypothetical protein
METSVSQIKKTKKTKQPIQQEPATPVPVQVQVPQESAQEQSQPEQKEIRLVDIPINDENVALNVMVGFLNVAHKRGVFTIDESAKIWECISKFQK